MDPGMINLTTTVSTAELSVDRLDPSKLKPKKLTRREYYGTTPKQVAYDPNDPRTKGSWRHVRKQSAAEKTTARKKKRGWHSRRIR